MQENIALAGYTTLDIGGPARWFAEARSEADIVEAVEFARSRNLPLFVLGGGSNLLVADAGFPGLVLHIALRGLRREEDGTDTIFTVAAGEEWDSFVASTVAANCAGVECLSGIPGTVGGTPVQNVGAYGQEVSSTIQRVRALDRTTLQWVEFDNAACEFAYRSSLFNTTARQRYIVSEVTYRLRRGGAPLLTYKDLAQRFSQYETSALTLAAVREAVREIRHRKGMLLVEGDPDCRSAGSFFKNPVLAAAQFAQLAEKFDGIPHYPAGAGTMGAGFVKIPAAWLIEQAGFSKGATVDAVGDTVGISSRHTLALVNRGGATAANLLALRDAIRARVTARFGIVLEQEPVYLSGE
jgi:UDP-N-acetylmuramate dehydrogenase